MGNCFSPPQPIPIKNKRQRGSSLFAHLLGTCSTEWVTVRHSKQHKPLKLEWQQLWVDEVILWNGQRVLYLDESPLLLLCGKQWFWSCCVTFHHAFQQLLEWNVLLSLPTSRQTSPHFSPRSRIPHPCFLSKALTNWMQLPSSWWYHADT